MSKETLTEQLNETVVIRGRGVVLVPPAPTLTASSAPPPTDPSVSKPVKSSGKSSNNRTHRKILNIIINNAVISLLNVDSQISWWATPHLFTRSDQNKPPRLLTSSRWPPRVTINLHD
ncbi:hypothetical protein Hamer_G013920 [Homarus americanus]|uniref:Uncharacterized protein n=1 Tax=Homarus americanus TaxID=6706 RepID=A0A8J5KFA9_HOMAM|nr:hypothetical protein Hamer_G013920 [Homarus americanus]